MATADNAELLAMSGPRRPAYRGLDPLEDLGLIADPTRSFVAIMNGGVLVKQPAG